MSAPQRLTPEQFALWLLGVIETVGDDHPSPEQWARIREQHAQTVAGLMIQRLQINKLSDPRVPYPPYQGGGALTTGPDPPVGPSISLIGHGYVPPYQGGGSA